MKLVLKGDLEVLGNFKVVQAMYATFQNALNALNKIDYENGKREISFTSNLSDLVGYTLKLVDNSTTKTITFIIK